MKLFIQLSHLDGVLSSGRLWHEPNVAQILQQVSGTLGLAKDLDGMAFCEYPKVIELVQNLKIQLRDLPANFGARDQKTFVLESLHGLSEWCATDFERIAQLIFKQHLPWQELKLKDESL